jgi:mTERF domain-containing protein
MSYSCDGAGYVIVILPSKVVRMLTAKPECLQEMATCTKGIGVPRGSGIQASAAGCRIPQQGKVDYLKKTFSWSDANVSIALTRAPMLLEVSRF